MSILKTGRPSLRQKALQNVQDNSNAMVRINFNIAKDLHKKIKQYALDNDITVTELIHKSVNKYMSI